MFKATRAYNGLLAVLEGYKAGELDLDAIQSYEGWKIIATWRFPEVQHAI